MLELEKDEYAVGLTPEQRTLVWYNLSRVDTTISFCQYTLPYIFARPRSDARLFHCRRPW